MNSNATFYVQSCLGPNIPEIVLRSVKDSHKVKFIFELNEDLEEDLQGIAVSEEGPRIGTLGGTAGRPGMGLAT